MNGAVPRAERLAEAVRRRELERRLAALGLDGERRDRAAVPSGPAFEGALGQRLRPLLVETGPLCATFAAYLGTRPDLLPIADCRELAATSPALEPLPAAALHAALQAPSGRAVGALLATVEDSPCYVGIATQRHRARLRDGRGALIEIARPGLEERLEEDLPLVAVVTAALGLPPAAASDFARALRRRADLAAQAEALGSAAATAPRLEGLRLPLVVASGPRLLCTAPPAGVPLCTGTLSAAERTDAARRVWVCWLHELVLARAVPVEFEPNRLLLLPGGALGVTAATMAALPASGQTGLYEYLEAAAGEDPAAALGYLLAEMEAEPRLAPAAEAALRHQVRQVVAFRDGAWGSALRGPGLAEELFVQWRLARQSGARPQPHLVDFYCGFAAVAAAAAHLAPPDRDPLAEALETLRLLRFAERTVRLADPAELRQALESYAAAFAELPASMDEALRKVARGSPAAGTDLPVEGERRGGPRTMLTTVLGLALAAVALLTQRLATAPLGSWVEGLGAAAFLLVGGLLLRVLARPG